MSEPRALKEQECRDAFLQYVRGLIDYCEKETRKQSVREKLELLVFAILVSIDGESVEVPGFRFIPNPHHDDREYRRNRGENWWPDDVDIGGCLHDQFCKMKGGSE